jgi:hypothetical protein
MAIVPPSATISHTFTDQEIVRALKAVKVRTAVYKRYSYHTFGKNVFKALPYPQQKTEANVKNDGLCKKLNT